MMDPESRPSLELTLRPRSVLMVTMAIVAALAAAHAMFVIVLPASLGAERGFAGLRAFFNMGAEANLPTWWSACLLLAAAAMLMLIAAHARSEGDRFAPHWFVLGCGFVYLSADEGAQLHEGVIASMWLLFFERSPGVRYYVWYAPALPVLLLLAYAFAGYFRQLPPRYRILFAASALLFLGGAIGVEMVEATLAYTGAVHLMPLSQLVEETMEMAGTSLFLYSLVHYLSGLDAQVVIRAAGLLAQRQQR